MKKHAIIAAFGMASAGVLSAQGLYNIGLGDDEPGESLPLRWTVGASVGYDTNASPIGSDCVDSDEAMYVSGFVQANYIAVTPRSTLDVWARLGIVYYLDDIRQTGPGGFISAAKDDTYYNLAGGVNWTARVNERLRFSSRNWIGYEMEPDYDYGFATDRRVGQYLRYSTDNSIGYRVSERFGFIAGYRLVGVAFDDIDGNDYTRHVIYLQGRYRVSPATVATFGYRYGWTDADAGDSDGSHYLTAGLEHKFSPTTVGVLRAGVQKSENRTAPYIEAALNSRMTDRFALRGFLRYGIDDRFRRIGTSTCAMYRAGLGSSAVYEESSSLRIGVQGTYTMTPRFSIHGGVNYIMTEYDDMVRGIGPSTLEEDLFNANLGFTMKLTDTLALTGSVNHTVSSSDSDIRDYDRTRYQIGAQMTF